MYWDINIYNPDEFDHDLTSWRHWNDGECIGEWSQVSTSG